MDLRVATAPDCRIWKIERAVRKLNGKENKHLGFRILWRNQSFQVELLSKLASKGFVRYYAEQVGRTSKAPEVNPSLNIHGTDLARCEENISHFCSDNLNSSPSQPGQLLNTAKQGAGALDPESEAGTTGQPALLAAGDAYQVC